MIAYEIRVFNRNGNLSVIIPTSCATDTIALSKIIRMGVIDYQNIEIWRDLDCIYVGREVSPRNNANSVG
jgi:hypothetical protein